MLIEMRGTWFLEQSLFSIIIVFKLYYFSNIFLTCVTFSKKKFMKYVRILKYHCSRYMDSGFRSKQVWKTTVIL